MFWQKSVATTIMGCKMLRVGVHLAKSRSEVVSPKLVDVLNVEEVTLGTLQRARQMMPLYGSISDIQATADLNWLIARKEFSGSAGVPRIKLF